MVPLLKNMTIFDSDKEIIDEEFAAGLFSSHLCTFVNQTTINSERLFVGFFA